MISSTEALDTKLTQVRKMLWEAYELDLEKLLDYPVWYADYEELPQTPYRFSMWQYSSTGSVPGIEENVDLNIQLLKK